MEISNKQNNKYKTYEDYLNHQKEKTSDPERRKKWVGSEWNLKFKGFYRIFDSHKKILSNAKNALCLGARTGQEVSALRELGIDAIGIDLVPHEPLVIEGDFHNIPFCDNYFSFVFTNCFDHSLYPEKFISEIERVLKSGGYTLIQVQLGIDSDKYTETDIVNATELIKYFKNSKIISARSIKKNFANMNYEILTCKEDSLAPKKDIFLSIVIVTFNRETVLKELLDSFKDQTDKDFEVVVAIDGSSDGTQEMLEEYKKTSPFELRWLDTGLKNEYGLAVARNMGIKEARGEVIVILDDDSFPVPEFVAEHKKTVAPMTLTGGGRTSTDPDDTELKDKMRAYLETYGDSTPQKFKPIPKYKWVVENNTCMYKKDWLSSGLFNESIRTYGSIGQVFNRNLIKKGFRYQFNPRAAIIHHVEYKQNDMYDKGRDEVLKTPIGSISGNNIRRFLRNKLPFFYNYLKKIKHWIEYR